MTTITHEAMLYSWRVIRLCDEIGAVNVEIGDRKCWDINTYTDLSLLRQSLDVIFVNGVLLSLKSGACNKLHRFASCTTCNVNMSYLSYCGLLGIAIGFLPVRKEAFTT